MAAIGLDFDEADARRGRIEGAHHRFVLGGREEPVGREGDDAEAGPGAAEGVGEPPLIVGGEVETIHRPRQVEIRVGVEAVDEDDTLVAEIGIDLEVGVETEGRLVAVLEIPPELAMQRIVGEVSDVGGHARHGEALPRAGAFAEVAAAPPLRIGHHRLAADLVEGDVLRRVPAAGRDRQCREDPLGIGSRPLQDLHAADRSAGDREERLDAEPVEQLRLRPHHVADGDHRQVEGVGLAGFGIDRGRAGRAHAAAEHVRADEEVTARYRSACRSRPCRTTSPACR